MRLVDIMIVTGVMAQAAFIIVLSAVLGYRVFISPMPQPITNMVIMMIVAGLLALKLAHGSLRPHINKIKKLEAR